jgi:hypothetical protein
MEYKEKYTEKWMIGCVEGETNKMETHQSVRYRLAL